MCCMGKLATAGATDPVISCNEPDGELSASFMVNSVSVATDAEANGRRLATAALGEAAAEHGWEASVAGTSVEAAF